MNLSRASSYAIHAVVYLAARKGDALVGSVEIARLLGISENRLVRILKPLVAARILWSLRGPGGGYRLGRPAWRISLLEILEAMDGPVHGGAPSLARPGHESVQRRLEAVCQQVAEWTRSVLAKILVPDLLEESDRAVRAAFPAEHPGGNKQLLPPEVAEGLERIRKLMAARDSSTERGDSG